MSHSVDVAQRTHRLGREFGQDLAAALVLASGRDANRNVKREMAQIVLRQINAAVERLAGSDFPPVLIEAYKQSAREGVRDELLKNRSIAMELGRAA